MATYMQATRPMTVVTPLGKDDLLLVSFTGQEGISQLFSFRLDLVAENKTDVPFEKLLGQKITVNLALPGGKERYFNGICSRVSQGEQDDTFTAYRIEIVPQFWLLTRKAQSRIFQHINAPDILKKVLDGVDVSYEIQGTFHPRDFCVQYRETDFNFASRVMEEEGIYYFFKHTSSGHKMVLANTPQSHPDMPEQSKVIFENVSGGARAEERIFDWEKVQELRSGKYTLWDHCFELPHKHLEADKTILDSVPVGKVTHKLKVGGNDKLELYDYPGEYAQRFDGVDSGGGDQPDELRKIFEDNRRTVKIRMDEETTPGITIQGTSSCRHFVSGHKFTLERHFNADGQYVVAKVRHSANLSGNYRSGETVEMTYQNEFACIPLALPYRPVRVTPKPVVQGTQTAVVVGPPGEEIFTDKYSRVKVQFHWDREGKYDADSSCWIRVGTHWAGKQWGGIHIPRIGQEVVVDFLEGDADQPIIIGSVYNAEQMPPVGLPAGKMVSGMKSNSTPGGGGYNEITLDDTKGKEAVTIHGQYDMNTKVENNQSETIGVDKSSTVGANKTISVGGDHQEGISGNKTMSVGGNHQEGISGNKTLTVGGTHTETITGTMSQTVTSSKAESITVAKALLIGAAYQVGVGAAMNETVGGLKAEEIGGAKIVMVGGLSSEVVAGAKSTKAAKISEKAGSNISMDAGANISAVAGGKIGLKCSGNFAASGAAKGVIDMGSELVLKCGGASIVLSSGGDIVIKGTDITVNGSQITVKGSGDVGIKGSTVKEN